MKIGTEFDSKKVTHKIQPASWTTDKDENKYHRLLQVEGVQRKKLRNWES